MSNKRESLINSLTQELQPVKVVNTKLSAVYWLLVALIVCLLMFTVSGSFREGAVQQVLGSAHFFLESLTGVIAIFMLIYAGFETAIPSAQSRFHRIRWSLLAMLVWIAFYVFGLVTPALAPSMLGKRAHCDIETIIFAVPVLLVGLYWANKQWPAYPILTGAVIGLAAGAIPALIMQFACMYDPIHILTHHILPGLSVGLLGALLGFLSLKVR
jgi:hypothetical protein